MKTSELLRLYRDGRRDFSGINLQGADLAGQDLSGANFSDCQIQGANFRGANLTGAKFIGAISGLQGDSDWLIPSGSLGLLLLSVSFIYSPCSAYIGYLIYWIFKKFALETVGILGILGVFSLIPFEILFHTKLRKILPVFLALTGALVLAPTALAMKCTKGYICPEVDIAGLVGFAIFWSMVNPLWGTIVGLLWLVPGLPAIEGYVYGKPPEFSGAFFVVMVTLWLNVLAYFMAYYTLTNQSNFLWTGSVRNLLLAWIYRGGTSFYNADLTDAEFRCADVKSANFQKAILTGTCWLNTRNINLARFDRSVSVK